MSIFLVKDIPLIKEPAGYEAVKQHNIPPYVDGSCRREPDLESVFPSITAICHGRNFAPRLHIGDIAVYITFCGCYPGYPKRHWRLTAILEVCERFSSHEQAAMWYHRHQLRLPSNCMVPYNPPLSLDKTIRRHLYTTIPTDVLQDIPERYKKHQLPVVNVDPIVAEWDQRYKTKTGKKGCDVFLVCRPMFPVNLQDPPILTKETMLEIFGEKAYQRTPPEISSMQFDKLKNVCKFV